MEMLELFKVAVLNKDFFTTIIVCWILFYVIKEFKKQNTSFVKSIKELTTSFETKIQSVLKEHEEKSTLEYKNIVEKVTKLDRDTKKSFANLALSSGNTVMDIEQTVNLLLTNMWYASDWKLRFLRELLRTDHFEGRKAEIRLKIEQELTRRSEDYIKEFKKYIVPLPTTDLSIWLEDNFTEKDFWKFIDQIVEILYSELKVNSWISYETVIEIKINDIKSLMKKLQQDLAKKLRKDCEEFKNL